MSAPTPRKKTATTRRNTMGRRPATFEDLINKPARNREIVLRLNDDAEVVVKLKALGSKAYDDLLSEHPPTPEQKREGQTYNVETFAPALIAACATEPALTPAEAKQIWTSTDWSRGEVTELFIACVEVCSRGLDVPFIETV